MNPTRIRVGCAGWSILARHAAHFPGAGSHLRRYAPVFVAVETNSSFYRPHQAATWAAWATAVPARFRFAVKMPRAFSHDARLAVDARALRGFLDPVGEPGDRLGPLLPQLPGSLPFERDDARVHERWPMFDDAAHGHARADALVTQRALRVLRRR